MLLCRLGYDLQPGSAYSKVTPGCSIGFVVVDADNRETVQSAANIVWGQILHKGDANVIDNRHLYVSVLS